MLPSLAQGHMAYHWQRTCGRVVSITGNSGYPWAYGEPQCPRECSSNRTDSRPTSPTGSRTLEAFCKATGRGYAHMGRPVPLADFVSYGEWFQSECGLAIEEKTVGNITTQPGGFVLDVDGEQVTARRVVMAVGPGHFAHMPEVLRNCLPNCARIVPSMWTRQHSLDVRSSSSVPVFSQLSNWRASCTRVARRFRFLHDATCCGAAHRAPAPSR